MPLRFEVSEEDLKVFLDEAEEMLQQMEEEILILEQHPENLEPLQAIFRAAHTLKGSSATLGHRQMAEITHAMENLLDKLRKGKLVAKRSVIDTLFACLDTLKTLKEEIVSGEPAGIVTDEVLAKLAEVEEAQGPSTAPAAAAPVNAAAAGGGAPGELDAATLSRIAAGRGRGLQPWTLTVCSIPDGQMPAVRFFQVLLALREVGEVITSWPGQEAIEQDQVGSDLQVVFLSSQAEQSLRHALTVVPEVTLQTLQPLALHEEEPAADRPAAAAGGDAAGVRRAARTVRVDVEVLDNLMNQVGELVIDRTRLTQFFTHLEAAGDADDFARELQGIVSHIGRVTTELQEEIMRARMMPVDNLFKKFPRMVRDLAIKAQKEIQLVVRGEETELDRSVIEEIGDPLMHLLRNAVDHGIEPPMERLKAGKPSEGTVHLEARHEENQIVITVRDDGRGIDPARIRAAAVRKGLLADEQVKLLSDEEAIRLIFAPGFSTAEKVSDISGRGVGMDVVHRNIERLNGAIEVRSEVGRGTEFRVKLPLTLAIIRALLVQHRNVVYAIPLASVTETVRWSACDVQTVHQREVMVNRGQLVPLLRLERFFGLPPAEAAAPADATFVVIVNVFGRHGGLVVEQLVGEGDVVIKSMGKYVGEIPGISGATILGDGSVALILDVATLTGNGLSPLSMAAAGRH